MNKSKELPWDQKLPPRKPPLNLGFLEEHLYDKIPTDFGLNLAELAIPRFGVNIRFHVNKNKFS